MKCTSHCRCGKHAQHKRLAYIGSTYGEQQTQRQHRMHTERKALGLAWRGTPSEDFDMDRAIAGLKRILKEVYGQ